MSESFWNTVVWCESTQRLKSKNLVRTAKHGGGSLMVWESFPSSGVGRIVKMDSKSLQQGEGNGLYLSTRQ